MLRIVTQVTDGDTFEVSQQCNYDNFNSSSIRIANFNAREIGTYGGNIDKKKLENLILHKTVDVRPVGISYHRIVADVYLNGHNIVNLL
ncbi:MAG: hypothetical protein ISS80_07460 [Candidatus Cloacimonetes bacterium]|nr:hypothetical protein [Candidatus Cloacimonadota bacterium]